MLLAIPENAAVWLTSSSVVLYQSVKFWDRCCHASVFWCI